MFKYFGCSTQLKYLKYSQFFIVRSLFFHSLLAVTDKSTVIYREELYCFKVKATLSMENLFFSSNLEKRNEIGEFVTSYRG